MRSVAGRVVAAATALLVLCSCAGGSGEGEPDASRQSVREVSTPPDGPFTRENTVVTAECSMGARYAAIAVRAWRPGSWRPVAERYFSLPGNAAFTNHAGAVEVHSPLVDLCRQRRDVAPAYAVDDAEYVASRVRALFDRSFSRMAVVLRRPGTDYSQAYVLHSDVTQDEAGRARVTVRHTEHNAVMSPDGRRVWFTYTDGSGRTRIGSRAAWGDQRVRDEGPASGHALPLRVLGQPPRALQAHTVRPSPDGRRVTATAPHVFGTVFDMPARSSALTTRAARGAVLLPDCVAAVSWVDATTVLCRTSSNSFVARDARSGRSVGEPITGGWARHGQVAEGVAVSADGRRFLVSVHPPNDPFPEEGDLAWFEVLSTGAGGGRARRVSHPSLSGTTVFLEWR